MRARGRGNFVVQLRFPTFSRFERIFRYNFSSNMNDERNNC